MLLGLGFSAVSGTDKAKAVGFETSSIDPFTENIEPEVNPINNQLRKSTNKNI